MGRLTDIERIFPLPDSDRGRFPLKICYFALNPAAFMLVAEIEELPRISKSKLGKRLAYRFPYLLFEIFGLK